MTVLGTHVKEQTKNKIKIKPGILFFGGYGGKHKHKNKKRNCNWSGIWANGNEETGQIDSDKKAKGVPRDWGIVSA